MTSIAVSGGFDPLHTGHIAFFKAAKKLGDKLIVIVENDEWVSRKHKPLMTQLDRLDLIREIKGVDLVIPTTVGGSCSAVLDWLRPDLYGVGRDHADHSLLPEYEVCQKRMIRIINLCHDRFDLHSSGMLGQIAWKPKYVNPPVTVSVLITRDRHVLLQKRTEGGKEYVPTCFELPGGFLEEGESLEDCGRREVKEELDVSLGLMDYLTSMESIYPPDGRKILSVYFTAKLNSSYKGPNWWIDSIESAKNQKFFAACDLEAVLRYFL